MSAGERVRVAVRQAQASEMDVVVGIMVEAFHDEPAFAFILPDEKVRSQALRKAFEIIVPEDQRAGRVFLTEDGEAAALWRKPGHMRESRWDALRTALPYLYAFGAAIGRASQVARLIKANLPTQDCWYLHYVGCRLPHRGKGYGGAVIRAGLELADAQGCSAYLETCDARNLPIYRALGFDVVGSWQTPGGPAFWRMMRPPSRSTND